MKRAAGRTGTGVAVAARAMLRPAVSVQACGTTTFIPAETRGAMTFIIAGPGDGAEYPHKSMAPSGQGTGKAVR